MNITFSRNHNGDPLVLVDGKVQAVAKKCEGFDYLRLHILAFNSADTAEQPEPWYGHKFKEHRDGEWRCDCGCDLKLFATPQVSDPQPAENAQSGDEREAAEKAYSEIFTGSLGAGFENFLRGWQARGAAIKHPVAQPAEDGLTDELIMKIARPFMVEKKKHIYGVNELGVISLVRAVIAASAPSQETAIRRFGIDWAYQEEEDCPDGPYVLYADHVAALSRAHTAPDRNAVLEKAARECERINREAPEFQRPNGASCARAIRALKDQPTAAPVIDYMQQKLERLSAKDKAALDAFLNRLGDDE